MFSFPPTVFLYFAIFRTWLQQLLRIVRWFTHLYSLGSTISTFSYIPAVPCFPEWSLSYMMSAFEELPTYSSFCRFICSRKTSNSQPIQRCWTEYYIWFKSPGLLQWCTSEACLLLRAIQILGLLMLETGFHLADLKPETVSSHLALGWDCRHLCEIQCRGGLMYTYFLCFLPILGKEYRDKRNLKDSLPTLLIIKLYQVLFFTCYWD